MAETSTYKAPNNVIKIPDGDTGYGIVKKAYRRFIWTWNDAPKNKDDYRGKKMKHINEWDDQFSGGRADDRKPGDFDQFELELGEAVEKEHTESENGPTEIAMDHLADNPKYYTEGFEKGVFDEDVTDVLNKWKTDDRAKKLMQTLGIEEDGFDGQVNLGEVPGMGRSDSNWIPGPTVGYKSGPLSNKMMMPTDWYADPDDVQKKRREMKNLKNFDNYIR